MFLAVILFYIYFIVSVYYGKTTIIFILSIKNLPGAETTTPMRGVAHHCHQSPRCS